MIPGITASRRAAAVGSNLRYLRMTISDWIFNGGANGRGAGDLRVIELKYMVGATKYPTVTMTSNTAPSPLVVTASTMLTGFGNHNGYLCFNNEETVTGDSWMTDSEAAPKWIQLDLGSGNGILPTSLIVTPDNAIFVGGGYYIKKFKIEGSNVGTFTGEQTLLYQSATLVQSDWASMTPKTFTF